MKILMTGSDGYIGSHLMPYLESRGHEVYEYQDDILEFNIDNTNIPDMVIHLAALTGVRKSIEMPEQYYEVNVIGTREVFQYYLHRHLMLKRLLIHMQRLKRLMKWIDQITP